MADDSLPRPARLDRGPRYPVGLRDDGVTGQVMAAFVIDSSGRVERPSITFVESPHPDFNKSICVFLGEALFTPARSGGVPQRTLVFMPFQFSLSTRPPLGPQTKATVYQMRARALSREGWWPSSRRVNIAEPNCADADMVLRTRVTKRALTLAGVLLTSSVIVPPTVRSQTDDRIRSSLRTVDVRSGRIETVHTEDRHFEAPNWSPDGRFFVVNSKGRLYRVAAVGDKRLEEIPMGFATRMNNDHGISPDGGSLVFSHHADEHITDPTQDWLASSIYVAPIGGTATPVKVTTKAPSFWHGWSPDGTTLAFVGRREGEWDIYAIPVAGGEERRLTTCRGLDDGPDYSHDGRFIYYNSFCSGKMQIWRMRADGSRAEQLTRDEFSNWFPHPSPDGRWVVYLAYLEDQGEAHPFGKQVKLRLMNLSDRTVRDLTPPFFGGQGTINVPSWSPDSRQVAFVEYARYE